MTNKTKTSRLEELYDELPDGKDKLWTARGLAHQLSKIFMETIIGDDSNAGAVRYSHNIKPMSKSRYIFSPNDGKVPNCYECVFLLETASGNLEDAQARKNVLDRLVDKMDSIVGGTIVRNECSTDIELGGSGTDFKSIKTYKTNACLVFHTHIDDEVK